MTWHLLGGTSTCHATLDSPCGTKIDLTNGITLKFNGMTILQHLYKDRDYFKFNIKSETNSIWSYVNCTLFSLFCFFIVEKNWFSLHNKISEIWWTSWLIEQYTFSRYLLKKNSIVMHRILQLLLSNHELTYNWKLFTFKWFLINWQYNFFALAIY